jgi:(p)ppGpp synthase/HD superfamily hydrolase
MLKVYEAIKFADRCHKGQKRKSTGAPYITHPIAVGFLLTRYKISKNIEDLVAACILHDVLEDTAATFAQLVRKFGPLVASLVQELTNDPVQVAKLGKLEYQAKKMVGMSSYALVCKLVDRLHNMMDHPSMKMVVETLDLMSRLKKGRKLTKTQKRIVEDIEARCEELNGGKEAVAA